MKRILFLKRLRLLCTFISFLVGITSCQSEYELKEEFHKNGKIKARYFTRNAQRDSLYEEYSNEGKLIYKGNYKNNHRVGIWLYCNLSNQKNDSSFLYYDSLGILFKEHYFAAFAENPYKLYLERIIEYGDDTIELMLTYHNNGKLNSEEKSLNEKLHGKMKLYNKEGKLFYESNFDHGFEQGTRKEWTKNTYKEIPFEKGFEQGLAKEWDLGSKNLLSEKMYEHGKLLWEKSYKDGKVIREKKYN